MDRYDKKSLRSFLTELEQSLATAVHQKNLYERQMESDTTDLDRQFNRRMRAFYDGEATAFAYVISEFKNTYREDLEGTDGE